MPINVFGAGAVQTAYVSYSQIDLTSNLQLNWPFSYQDNPNLVTAAMDVITAAETNFTITLPKATEASVGQNFIIRNKGNSNFNLLNHDGGNIGTIAVGIAYYYYLADNSTDAGDWQSITFGAGTAEADATDLAGNGLTPISGLLNTNIPVVTTAGPSFTVNPTERANLIVWTGGTGTLNLPAIGSVPNGYYFAFNNEGSGVVTITGNAPLDNITGTLVEIGQSLMVISDSTKWWSLGFGQQTFFSVSVLNKDVSGSANVTLTAAEADKNIIQFQGTLTGNITVFFPVAANQWSIFNNTTGAYTLTIQLVGGTSLSYTIPQDNRQMFYSDGTELYNTPTIINPSAITFPDGNVTNPGMAFTESTGTGFYLTRPTGTEDQLGISVKGTNLGTFINDAGTTDIEFTSTNTIKLASYQVQLSGETFISSGNLNVVRDAIVSGNASVGVNSANVLVVSATSRFNAPIRIDNGTVTSASIQNITNANTGLYFPTTTSVGIATSGTQAASFSSTGIALNQPVTCSSTLSASSLTLGTPLAIASGGTGQTTKTAAFNALSPTTTAGDMIARDNVGNDVRVPASTIANEVLLSRVGNIPVWGGYSVLQVQSFTLTTGQTYVAPTSGETDTQLTLSITPTSVNSKILVLVSYNGCMDASGVVVLLKRNASFIINNGGAIGNFFKIGTVFFPQNISINYLDSPATTSACVYTVATGPEGSGTVNVYSNQSSDGLAFRSTITLIELGGF